MTTRAKDKAGENPDSNTDGENSDPNADLDKASRPDSAPDQALDVGGEDSEGEQLDFSQVSTYDPVPPDRPYIGTITKFETGKAKTGTGRTAAVELTVAEPVEFETRKITRSYSLQPQSLFSIYNLLVSAGEDPEKLKQSTFTLVPTNYLGIQVVVFPNDNVYQGATTSQIRRTAPLSEWEELKKVWEETEEGEQEELPF